MTDLQKFLRMFNLKPTAVFSDVKTAYHRMVKEWHPDLYTDDPGMRMIAEDRIKEINVAYDFLERHFSRKHFRMRDKDGKESNVEPAIWQPLEKDLYWSNVPTHQMLPAVHAAFKEFGMKDLCWNTYLGILRGTWEGTIGKTHNSLDTEVEITSQNDRTKVRFGFRYTHHSDNTHLGLEEGPDMAGAVGRFLADPRFDLEVRPNLAMRFFQDFQIHEVTWSEFHNGLITAEMRGNRLDIGGVTINQLFGILYKAFTECGVERTLWNTEEKVIFGTTGWSLRSVGQLIKGVINGSDRQFGVTLQSRPLAVGRVKESHLSDQGRGQEDEKKIRQLILDQLRRKR